MPIFGIFRPSGEREAAVKLYFELVAQARRPEFYSRLGVPDTVDGRFDMIALHAFLVLNRLKRDRHRTAGVGQALFDVLFEDMDRNLREMGVGDLSVGKRIKAMGKAFYGRIAAYETGLASEVGPEDEGNLLEDALRRNLYRHGDPGPLQLAGLADYLKTEVEALGRQDVAAFLSGRVDFGPPPLSDSVRL